MKSVIKLSVIILGLALYLMPVSQAHAGTDCTTSSTFALHTGPDSATAPSEDGYCYYTPTAMNIKIYEFGLCTAASSPTNKSSCETMFENTTGIDFNLSVGSVSDLLGDMTVTEGVTYTHAYIVLSNETSIVTSMEFTVARTDDSGNTGRFCFTDGRSVNDVPSPDSIMSCSDDPNDAVAAPETILFGDPEAVPPVYANDALNYTIPMDGRTVVSDLYMIKTSGEMSNSWATDHAIYGSQRLQTPITINADSSSMDLGFSITDGVVVGFEDLNFDPSLTAPIDVVFEGLKFIISVN